MGGFRLPVQSISAFLLLSFIQISAVDIGTSTGTASYYSPPYTPTACFGGFFSQFPMRNLFAAAGEGIWDNGAACGRQYKVKCINAPAEGACLPPERPTITVTIVDRAENAVSQASRPGCLLVLSKAAYEVIVNATVAPYVNIEFQEL